MGAGAGGGELGEVGWGVKELLKLQNLLDGLGSETARADFMSGSNGAVVSRDGGGGVGE